MSYIRYYVMVDDKYLHSCIGLKKDKLVLTDLKLEANVFLDEEEAHQACDELFVAGVCNRSKLWVSTTVFHNDGTSCRCPAECVEVCDNPSSGKSAQSLMDYTNAKTRHKMMLLKCLHQLQDTIDSLPPEHKKVLLNELETGSSLVWGVDSQLLWFEFEGVRYRDER